MGTALGQSMQISLGEHRAHRAELPRPGELPVRRRRRAHLRADERPGEPAGVGAPLQRHRPGRPAGDLRAGLAPLRGDRPRGHEARRRLRPAQLPAPQTGGGRPRRAGEAKGLLLRRPVRRTARRAGRAARDQAHARTGRTSGEAVSEYEDLLATGTEAEPPVVASDGDIIGLAFTSGTTGLPKGVLQSQRMMKAIVTEQIIEFRMLPRRSATPRRRRSTSPASASSSRGLLRVHLAGRPAVRPRVTSTTSPPTS